jgi:RND family efflux transporter MFP subunit
MKRTIAIVALAVSLAGGAFTAGSWWAHRAGTAPASGHPAAVYICPMHPDYHSDHPGDCPACGMSLERVPDQGTTNGGAASAAPPRGSVQVSLERQQAIGIRVGVVGRAAGAQLLRTTGRVVADDNRTYAVVAAVSGWVRSVGSVAAGDTVTKDQVLASLFAPDAQFERAQQSYYDGLEMLYRAAGGQAQSSHDAAGALREIERLADGLRSLGVANSQVRELAKRRELVHDIRIESPADGVVLKRGVSPGLRFDRGFEFYRIADLNRVWVLADVSREQLPFVRPGADARITTPQANRALAATASAAEPLFDEISSTLKVRLEAANPRRMLKPGMFVDVEFPVHLPAALVVPADAVVNSGLRKTVFVDCGDGHFEPRLVETGRHIGDDVEVTKGLTAGERIVISGTFFIDSESRMKAQP